jgi:hypothetical protein
LKSVGLSVAEGGLAATPDAAVAIAANIGAPVVLKRPIGGNGDGVIPSIRGAEMCRSAAAKLLEGHPHIIVEKMVPGVEFRVHLSDGRITEIRHVTQRTITGDGQSSCAQLIQSQHASLWDSVCATAWIRQRLIFALWHVGVREFEDLNTVAPKAGDQIVIRSGISSGRDGLAPMAVLHERDWERIENAFDTLGSPSGAVDLILSHVGGRLADCGAVLEVNIPCGMAYLDDAREVAEREMEHWIERDPEFAGANARTPLVIVPRCEPNDEPGLWDKARQMLCQHYRTVTAIDHTETGGWMPAIMSNADAVLLAMSELTAIEYGLPLNAHPTLIIGQADLERMPILEATLAHCGSLRRTKVSRLLDALDASNPAP